MNDFLFITLYLLVPILGYLLLRAAKIQLLQISIPSIFFIYFLMGAYIGIIAIYFNWTWYEHIDPNDSIGILRVCFYSASTLLMTTFGFWLASRLKGSREASQWAPAKPANRSIYYPLMFMIVLCVVATSLYLNNFSTAALSASLEGDLIETALLRSQMANDFQGAVKFHYYGVFFQSLLPFCTFVLVGQAILRRSVPLWLVTFGTFGIAFYTSLMRAEKAPAIWLILGCIIVYAHTVKGKLRARNLVLFAMSAVVLIALMVTFFIGLEGRSVGDLSAWAVSRIFAGSIIPSYVYLDFFPKHHDFLWGLSLPNPGGIFPWENYHLTIEMAKILHGIFAAETVGSAPTAYWAEVYANFGPIAPLLVAPIVGFYIYVIHLLTNKLRPSPIKSALICWCSLHFMNLAITGISNYLFDTDLMIIFLFTGILLISSGELRVTFKNLAKQQASIQDHG